MSASECINTLLGQYLERKGKIFLPTDKTVKYIIRRYLLTLGTEWDLVKETLEKLRKSSRNPVSHTPEGRELNKSRAMRKKALNHKGEYVVVHMESLFKIRKDFQNYEREKEV